jgi:transcriptional regulator with XRE-family HTH domain
MAVSGFGARVRKARLDLAAARGKEVSQSEIARALHVTPSTVQRWENGGTAPDIHTINDLAKLLKVDPGSLAFGRGTPLEQPSDTIEQFQARKTASTRKRKGTAR